jgi:hypothetical protein
MNSISPASSNGQTALQTSTPSLIITVVGTFVTDIPVVFVSALTLSCSIHIVFTTLLNIGSYCLQGKHRVV